MKIEKGIKIPKLAWGKFSEVFDLMKKGDSFLVKKYRDVCLARHMAKYRDVKIMCRSVKDGYRIWRIK